MKAVVNDVYGPPDVLRLTEIEKPFPKDNEVLIRIYATAVNSGDVRMRKADPFLVRFMLGLFKPRIKIMGIILSGEVEALGKDVTRFKQGDQVYGLTIKTFGAYAEYKCLPEDAVIAIKPANLSYPEAAAIPFGANTALHFLRKAKLQAGQKILIYGASGSVGTAAVQLAKIMGAEVAAVCSAANASLVKSLGADLVIDYNKEDFSKNGKRYDIVFDAVGMSPFSGSVNSLNKNGSYIRVVHMSLPPILRGLGVSLTSSKKVIGGVAIDTVENLNYLTGLIEAGQLKPVIDRTYPLEQLAEAHRYVDGGHKKGNVVITV